MRNNESGLESYHTGRSSGGNSASSGRSRDDNGSFIHQQVSNEGPIYAVHEAANDGNVKLLERLLAENANFDAYDNCQRTPLYFAVAQNQVECVSMLLYFRNDLIELGDDSGDKPLHIAAAFGNLEALNLLLEFSANINSRNQDGCTPMHLASTLVCAKSLMKFGADLFALDKDGRIPLFSACTRNKVTIVVEILNDPNCDAKTMIYIQDSFGDTPLHAAASNGSIDCIKAMKGFIDMGILTATNVNGYTPENLAQVNNQIESLEYLQSLYATLCRTQQQQEAGGWNDYNNNGLNSGGGNGGGNSFFASDWGFQVAGQSNPYGQNQGSDFSGAARPQTAGIRRSARQSSSQGSRPRTREISQRPQTSHFATSTNQSQQQDTQENVQDIWGAFCAPYEEPQEEHRPITPWTRRRQRGTVDDWHGEWAQFTDEESGNPFWWNSITGECQWETPQAVAAYAASNEYADEVATSYEYATEASWVRQRAVVVDRFGDWSECEDPVTHDKFFYNSATGECEWELPADVAAQREEMIAKQKEEIIKEAENEAAELLYQAHQTQQTGNDGLEDDDAIICVWTQEQDASSGAMYYLNNETGETSWECPQEYTLAVANRDQRRIKRAEEKARQEAAAELDAKLKSIISSTEEERASAIEKMRQEFEKQMQQAAEQTRLLAESMEKEKDAERKKREQEILRLQEKEHSQKHQEKISAEKSEILSEHTEELKNLASVLGADRIRQNDMLQEKLLERRRARALKRSQILSQKKTPEPPTIMSPKNAGSKRQIRSIRGTLGETSLDGMTPAERTAALEVTIIKPLSPREKSQSQLPTITTGPTTPKTEILVAMPESMRPKGMPPSPVHQMSEKAMSPKPRVYAAVLTPLGRSQSTLLSNQQPSSREEMTLDHLICEDMDNSVSRIVEAQPAVKGFIAAHLQYLPNSEMDDRVIDLEGKGANMSLAFVWSVFHKLCIEDVTDWSPGRITKASVEEFLSDAKLKLLLEDRNILLQAAFDKRRTMSFRKFKEFLVKVWNKLGVRAYEFLTECLMSSCTGSIKSLNKRSKKYQRESKVLATNQVRMLLQSNVSQLKSLFSYYSFVADKQKEKTVVSLRHMLHMCKDFGILAKHPLKIIIGVYSDMSLRKPGPISCLQNYDLPFNQWVQMLFHLALRLGMGSEEESTSSIVALLQFMDQSGAKEKLHKSLEPFVCILPLANNETSTS